MSNDPTAATPPPPEPYQVVYSERVRQELRVLTRQATEQGRGEEFAAALREFDRLLRLYPQFGEPLVDLTAEQGQIWRGVVPPLVMRYGILEERRMVMVAALPLLLPNTGV